jgi:uncharacterized Zn finger protein
LMGFEGAVTRMGYYGFKPYVSVAKRRAQAAKEVAKRIKKGQSVAPVHIEGRTIASTFWGQAWCTNLEGYSDFENRLPRGRTYVRNGSVVDLKIAKGRIEALVSGSELYEVQIEITALPQQNWRALKVQCTGKIGSLVELLQGKLSKAVMEKVTDRQEGLFPKPKEIKMRCSCPDYAGMCKHVAAAMYGVGNRLDSSPELLFVLRGVDHRELIEQAIPTAPVGAKGDAPTISTDDLGALFGIEIGEAPVAKAETTILKKPVAKPAAKKAPTAKKAAVAKVETTIPEKPVAKPAAKKAPTAKKAEVEKADAKINGKPAAKPAVKKAPTAKKASAKKADAKINRPSTTKQAIQKQSTAKKAPAAKKTKAKPVTRKG